MKNYQLLQSVNIFLLIAVITFTVISINSNRKEGTVISKRFNKGRDSISEASKKDILGYGSIKNWSGEKIKKKR